MMQPFWQPLLMNTVKTFNPCLLNCFPNLQSMGSIPTLCNSDCPLEIMGSQKHHRKVVVEVVIFLQRIKIPSLDSLHLSAFSL